jgi:hypothetical protein
LAALLFSLNAAEAFCQTPGDASTVPYGILFGASRHRWTSAPPEAPGPGFNAEPDHGAVAGFYLGGKPSARFGVMWEILVASKGSAHRRTDGERIEYSFWTVDSPLLLRVALLGPQRRTVSPVVVAGAAPEFRITGLSVRGEDGREVVSLQEPNRFDLGLILGAGLQMNRFGIEVRYTHGLRHVFFGPPVSPLIKARGVSALVRVGLQ